MTNHGSGQLAWRLTAWLAGLACGLACVLFGGCANLVVKKVPLEDRQCGEDDQQGFRYYLTRPYLVVKKSILISERRTLVELQDGIMKFLEGPKAGQSVPSMVIEKPAEPASETKVTLREEQPNLTIPSKDSLKSRESSKLQGDMEIVHLPDLDEQYVIKSKNKLAKSAFGLAFQDGAALAEVQGEHDATTLAVSILKEIQDAIGAAQEVAQAAVTRENNILKEQQKTAQGKDEKLFRAQAERAAKVGRHSIYQMVESISIKPGVYRLNKPWEIEGEGVLPTGQGLLAQMGLPMVRGVRFEPLASVEKP